ncbi:MAG: AAA family ATPase [Actinophytocola sp.]|nr:AAA family ATPase [Actinophytocola sp.]
MARTRRPRAANARASSALTVVLPTPPLPTTPSFMTSSFVLFPRCASRRMRPTIGRLPPVSQRTNPADDEGCTMRIGIAGKGGVGKTTIAATMARLAARSGATVIAIDADSNPNLAPALGLDRAIVGHPLPVSVVSKRLDGPALTATVDSVLVEHGTAGPDGVVLLSMGGPAHAGEGCLCSAHATVGAVLGDLDGSTGGPDDSGGSDSSDTVTVVDMEASPEQLSRGTVRNVDVLLLVAEPYFRSLETVRRLAPLAAELSIARVAVIANKLRSAADGEAVAEFCARHDLSLLASVPYDAAVADADVAGRPLLDVAPDSPAVAAIEALARRLHAVSTAGG